LFWLEPPKTMTISKLIEELEIAKSRYRDAEIHAYNKDGELKPVTAIDMYFTIRGAQEIERVFVDTAE
jgi:hypothetical protein